MSVSKSSRRSEAMTKELAIKAPMDGEVDNPAMEAGDLVEADAVLLEMGSDQ